MKSIKNKILAALVSFCMVLTLAPAASADEGIVVPSSPVSIGENEQVSTEVWIQTKVSFMLQAVEYSMFQDGYNAGRDIFCVARGGKEPFKNVVWKYAKASDKGVALNPGADDYVEISAAAAEGPDGTYTDASGDTFPKFSLNPKALAQAGALNLESGETYYFQCWVTDTDGHVATIDKPIQLVMDSEYRPGPLFTNDGIFSTCGKKDEQTGAEGMFHRLVSLVDSSVPVRGDAYDAINQAAAELMPPQKIDGIWHLALSDAPDNKLAYTGGPITVTIYKDALTAAGVEPTGPITVWWLDTATGVWEPVQMVGEVDADGNVTFLFEGGTEGDLGIFAVTSADVDNIKPGLPTSYTIEAEVVAGADGALGGQVAPAGKRTYATSSAVCPVYDIFPDPLFRVKSATLVAGSASGAAVSTDIDVQAAQGRYSFAANWFESDMVPADWDGTVVLRVEFERVEAGGDDDAYERTITVVVSDDCGRIGNNVAMSAQGKTTIVYAGRPGVFTFDKTVPVNLLFTAETGYGLASLKRGPAGAAEEDCELVAQGVPGYSIAALEDSAVYYVRFAEMLPPASRTHIVDAQVRGQGGSVSPAQREVSTGESATFVFDPSAGYELAHVWVRGADFKGLVTGNTFTLNNVQEDTTVEFEFAPRSATSHMVSVDYNEGGVVDPSSSQYVEDGGTVTFKVAPDEGYKLKLLRVYLNSENDKDYVDLLDVVSAGAAADKVVYDSDAQTVTLKDVRNDMSLLVQFEKSGDGPDSSSSSSSGSSSSSSSSGSSSSGSSSSGSSSSGSSSSGSSSGGSSSGGDSSSSGSSSSGSNSSSGGSSGSDSSSSSSGGTVAPGNNGDPNDPNAKYYTLNAKVYGRGTVDGGTTRIVRVKEHSDYTFTLEPNSGYQLLCVKDNRGVAKSNYTDRSYTLRDVTSNHDLEFTFGAMLAPGPNDETSKSIRRLQTLAKTGDLTAPLALALVSIGCGAAGIAVFANNRRRSEYESAEKHIA